MNSLKTSAIAILGAIALHAGQAGATFIQPNNSALSLYGWTRPADLTTAEAEGKTYQYWETFTSPAGPNAPQTDLNPYGSAPNAYDSSGGSFITSGGNIYSFSVPLSMHVEVPGVDPGEGYSTKFLVQLKTLGTEIDFSTFKINGISISTLPDYSSVEMSRVALGGFGGAEVEQRLTFTLPSETSYSLTWQALGSSNSMDVISIDTALPEPASMSVVGLAAAGLLKRRKR